ncbi:hypothetical protein COOONC_22457 [Cooperia oncophora]
MVSYLVHWCGTMNTGNWSLIFADSLFTVCGYGIARLSGSHHVMIHSSDIEGPHGVAKGFHRNYALLPPNFMSYAQTSFDVSSAILSSISKM